MRVERSERERGGGGERRGEGEGERERRERVRERERREGGGEEITLLYHCLKPISGLVHCITVTILVLHLTLYVHHPCPPPPSPPPTTKLLALPLVHQEGQGKSPWSGSDHAELWGHNFSLYVSMLWPTFSLSAAVAPSPSCAASSAAPTAGLPPALVTHPASTSCTPRQTATYNNDTITIIIIITHHLNINNTESTIQGFV